MLRLLMLVITLTLLTGSVLGNIDNLMGIIFGRRGLRIGLPVHSSYVVPAPVVTPPVVPSAGFSYGFDIGR